MMFFLFPRPEQHRIEDTAEPSANSHRELSKPTSGGASENGHARLSANQSRISALTDPQLIERVAAGDEAASAVLFERYSDYVFRIAAAILKDRHEAQDVVQETFCLLWRTAKHFDSGRGSFPAWVCRIASQRAIKRKHHLRTQPSYNALEIEEREPQSLARTNEFSWAPQEQNHLMNELLTTLTPAQRRATMLKFFEGLTAEQGANRTGESSSGFENHVYRGLKKLREIMRKKE